MGKWRVREGIQQGSRPMNIMHKVHNKFLMQFSFHREARFASTSPDYDIFSQRCRHGFAYFNVNLCICANSQIPLVSVGTYSHTRTGTHTPDYRRLLLLREANRTEVIPTLIPHWISLVASLLFPVTDYLRDLLSDKISVHRFKLEERKKWADVRDWMNVRRSSQKWKTFLNMPSHVKRQPC